MRYIKLMYDMILFDVNLFQNSLTYPFQYPEPKLKIYLVFYIRISIFFLFSLLFVFLFALLFMHN